MDRPFTTRERVALGAVAAAFGLGVVTAFLPFGYWSTAPRGYVIGAIALTSGLLLGLVDTGPTLRREGAVDLLLSAVLGWLVGFSVVVHGELVVDPWGTARATPLELLGYRALSAAPTYTALGVTGFVVGTVVRTVSMLLGSLALRHVPEEGS